MACMIHIYHHSILEKPQGRPLQTATGRHWKTSIKNEEETSTRLGFGSAAMLLAATVQLHAELALPQLPGGCLKGLNVV